MQYPDYIQKWRNIERKPVLNSLRAGIVYSSGEEHYFDVLDRDRLNILTILLENPFVYIRANDIREKGMDPQSVNRAFIKYFGCTFQTFQRMHRLNYGYRQLMSTTEVEESVSNIFGRKNNSLTPIYLQRIESALGPMYAAATDDGLCLLEFTDRRMLETEFKDLCHRKKGYFVVEDHPILEQVRREILEYFAGDRLEFDTPMETPGTAFQQQVWSALVDIPYGETVSYSMQAQKIGSTGAVRAVARANGMNRIAIVIPCHRVVGADGSLTGYAGGLDRKETLIAHEKSVVGQPVQLKFTFENQ